MGWDGMVDADRLDAGGTEDGVADVGVMGLDFSAVEVGK